MVYELLTQKLNKMDKEKILLDALNTFGNFTSVEQEFNHKDLKENKTSDKHKTLIINIL